MPDMTAVNSDGARLLLGEMRARPVDGGVVLSAAATIHGSGTITHVIVELGPEWRAMVTLDEPKDYSDGAVFRGDIVVEFGNEVTDKVTQLSAII